MVGWGQPSKAVGAPAFASDPMMYEKQTVRIVFRLDRAQARIVRTPIRGLPVALEKIAFSAVSPCKRGDLLQFPHCLVDLAGMAAGGGEVGFVTGEAGKRGRTLAGNDRQRESVEHRRVHRRLAGRGDSGFGPAVKPL